MVYPSFYSFVPINNLSDVLKALREYCCLDLVQLSNITGFRIHDIFHWELSSEFTPSDVFVIVQRYSKAFDLHMWEFLFLVENYVFIKFDEVYDRFPSKKLKSIIEFLRAPCDVNSSDDSFPVIQHKHDFVCSVDGSDMDDFCILQ